MPEMHLYEYAVIRVVPRVEREEFFNVGVVLFCKSLNFLRVKFGINEMKFSGFCNKIELEELLKYLESFEKIANGLPDSGFIGTLPTAERFRWLTATRSTVIQTSKIHPGYTENPALKLENLFEELVA